MTINDTDKTITEKSLNDVQGFLCPVCERVRIKLSLPQFLSSAPVVCPVCGTNFHMDKSQCTGLINMLQDLNVATENVRALKGDK